MNEDKAYGEPSTEERSKVKADKEPRVRRSPSKKSSAKAKPAEALAEEVAPVVEPEQTPAEEVTPKVEPEETPAEEVTPKVEPEETPAEEITPEIEPEEAPAEEVAPEAKPEQTPAEEVAPKVEPEQTPAEEVTPEAKPEQTPAEEVAPEAEPEQTPAEEVAPEAKPEEAPAEELAPEIEPEEAPAEELAPEIEPEEKPAEEVSPEVEPEEKPAEEVTPEVEPEKAPAEELAPEIEPEQTPAEEIVQVKEPDDDEKQAGRVKKRFREEKGDKDSYDPEKPRAIDTLFDFVELFVFTLVAVLVIVSFLFRHSVVEGGSMINTLHDGDVLIISDIFYDAEVGDIVVIDTTTHPSDISMEKLIIKRIIAKGGDTVRIYEDGVYVNGSLSDQEIHAYFSITGYKYPTVPSPEYTENPEKYNLIIGNDYYQITVPEGDIFVLGDHRNNSKDSEEVGTFTEEAILGRVLVRVYPFEDFGKVDK